MLHFLPQHPAVMRAGERPERQQSPASDEEDASGGGNDRKTDGTKMHHRSAKKKNAGRENTVFRPETERFLTGTVAKKSSFARNRAKRHEKTQ